MKVLKFGGTSVGSASRMHNVSEIVSLHQPVIVVLSAVSGTTNSLVDIIEAMKSEQLTQAAEIVENLRLLYAEFINNLYSSDSTRQNAQELITQQLSNISDRFDREFLASDEFHILAKGEMISTQLFHLLLVEQGKASTLLNSLDFLTLNESGAPDEEYLADKLSLQIKKHSDSQILVSQGFICRDAKGKISNLERGGSDYSASLFGAAINADEIQIWTDIDGMHNNDPRYIENTKPVRELSFNEAAELAYFGAKILHPASIKPARKSNISVRLLNSLNPTAVGTLISSKTKRATIKAVAAKSGITAIKIRSSEMLQAPGFLHKIFEVFEHYQTSIDMVTTSEVAVSVTIDDTSSLQTIVKVLSEFAHIEIDDSLSIICIVGEHLVENSGLATKVIGALEGTPIRMISYGGSAHNISLLVSEESKTKALQALHDKLFNNSKE